MRVFSCQAETTLKYLVLYSSLTALESCDLNCATPWGVVCQQYMSPTAEIFSWSYKYNSAGGDEVKEAFDDEDKTSSESFQDNDDFFRGDVVSVGGSSNDD
jgi:hypothetical protein